MAFKSTMLKRRNKIKIGIFTAIVLMQYLCLHGTLLFSKSYPEIQSTRPIVKCRGRKSFDMWYYIVTCATLCVKFSLKSNAINVFPKYILKLKARDQSIRATKKLFCHLIIKNYLCNVSWKFLIKRESIWRWETKEQVPQLTLLYRGKTARSSHRRCCKRKLFFKILQYPREIPALETFRPATLLKRDLNAGVFLLILPSF